MAKIKSIVVRTHEIITSQRAKAEIGAGNYVTATLKDATVKVVMKQNRTGKQTQKTFYFKKA